MGCGIIVLQSVDVSSSPEHRVLGISSRFLSILTALCPDLSDPANGTVTQFGNSAGYNATYVCDEGYELVGAPVLNCQGDGTWDNPPPTCTRESLHFPLYFCFLLLCFLLLLFYFSHP